MQGKSRFYLSPPRGPFGTKVRMLFTNYAVILSGNPKNWRLKIVMLGKVTLS